MENLLCDFCGDKEPKWEWECENFDFIINSGRKNYHAVLEKNWLACDFCHTLILEKNQSLLATKSAKSYLTKYPESCVNFFEIASLMFFFQSCFFNKKSGKYYPAIFGGDND